jgi:hypothetical protein
MPRSFSQCTRAQCVQCVCAWPRARPFIRRETRFRTRVLRYRRDRPAFTSRLLSLARVYFSVSSTGWLIPPRAYDKRTRPSLMNPYRRLSSISAQAAPSLPRPAADSPTRRTKVVWRSRLLIPGLRNLYRATGPDKRGLPRAFDFLSCKQSCLPLYLSFVG